jgi:hypothetical protein
MDEPLSVEDFVNRVKTRHPDGDELVHLGDAIAMTELLEEISDQLIGHFVDAARNAGVTWAEIGKRMGVTRQAVQKRFVSRPDAIAALGDVYDRFTPRAKKAIEASDDEARNAGHIYVGTEHLVLGLLSQPDGLAARALSETAPPERVREAVTSAFGPRCDEIPERIPFTPRAKKAIDLTLHEAQRLGHDYIGTEHILLGVLAEQQGIGAKVLTALGVSPAGIEEWLAAH